ncbi:hypothetical protein HDE_12800 [Halotydeus destructor]|nr:hypothetical protein HDE_12800 [Halotydeus destructor]
MSNCVDSSSNQVLMTACSLNNARSLCVEFPQNVVVDAEVIDKGMCSRDINNVNKGQNKRPLETGSEENFAKVLRVEEPSITQEKLRILNDVTRARRNQPATEAEIELRKTIERKRQARKKWNRKYWERTGRRITMVAIDRVKRIAAENDSLDSNLGDMMKVIDQLQVKFETKLAKRQQDIQAGLVDPEEAKGRTKSDRCATG